MPQNEINCIQIIKLISADFGRVWWFCIVLQFCPENSKKKSENSSFFRAYLFKRGQVEHLLTMANLKLKPSLFIRPALGQHLSNVYPTVGYNLKAKLIQLQFYQPAITQRSHSTKTNKTNKTN